MQKLYAERTVKILDYQDIKSIKNSSFEQLVLSFNIGNRTYYKDVGFLCYSLFKTPTPSRPARVVLSSLKPSRAEGLKKYIISILKQNLSIESIKSYISSLVRIYKFINESCPDVDFRIKNNCYELFKDYTNYLLTRIVLLDKGSISENTASGLQDICANYLSLAYNLDTKNIFMRASRIHENRADKKVWSTQENNLDKFFLYNISIFLNIKDFLIKKQSFPVNFKFEYKEQGINIDFLYQGMGRYTKQANQSNWSEHHEFLANKAIHAFLYCFTCVTAANLSSLKLIEIDNFKTVPTTKGKRTFVPKNRAGGDHVPIEFGVDFLQTYNEYIEFRKWLLSNYSDEFKGDCKDFLFFYLPSQRERKNSFTTLSMITANSLNGYKSWYLKYFAFKWIPLRGVRQLVSTEILKLTNSVRIAALKLGNDGRTFLKNYGNTTFNDSANELSLALDSIFEKNINEIIYKKEYLNAVSTPMAHCLNLEKFTIDVEVNIEPDCRKPESCLFCSNLVLHADSEDIKKLLSVLDMLRSSKQKTSEQALQIQERIIFLLNEMQNKFPETKEIIESVQQEIDEGDLDEYWSEISMTLSVLEVV